MSKRTNLVCVVLVAGAAIARGQSVASRVRTAPDQALLMALIAAEDSRDSILLSTDPRRRGLAARNPFIRAFTVRGLGRLERASLIPLIAPALGDSDVDVRSAAADALAQSATHGGVAGVRALLTAHLRSERLANVRAAMLEAVGRLVQGSPDQVKATANMIVPSLASNAPEERRGAIRGIFFLARKPEARDSGVIPTDVTYRVFAMLMEKNLNAYSAADRVNLATILVNAAAMDDARMLATFAHRDPSVRDRAVGAILRATDTATVRSIVSRAVADSAPLVRFRSIGAFARRLRATDGCAPLARLARDADMTVALAATDALAGCRGDSLAVRLLDSLAASFVGADRWHLATHAFVALSALDPSRAHAQLPWFAKSENVFVRMYADTAALLMRDTAALYRLARDAHPNVQTSAIVGLSKLVGHGADSIYIAALKSDDNQLLMAASAALKGSKSPGAVPALSGASSRLGSAKLPLQTSRDGVNALVAALADLTGAAHDNVGRRVFPKTPTPTFADLATIEQVEATIEMVDGARITLRFHPFDAPTNAARFVRLAKAHTFDGLTFHRVAPFFVVQGPSPNANEYSAPDGPFTRDELGLENLRGTIGLSTRGRDTGDGQIYINTVDNTWLDHEYTVMATITSGLEAFDHMQEGARIRRVTVAPRSSRPARSRIVGR